jgi:ATP-binding cassette subfamily C protein
MDRADDTPITAIELGGNRVLALDDPRAAWLVRSGRLAVFTLPLDGSAGPRHYRFDREAGQALFGLPGHGTAPRPGLIAVTLEPTVLERLSPDEAPARHAASWIECWSRVVGEPPLDLGSAPGAAGELATFHRQLAERLAADEREARRVERERLSEAELRSSRATAAALGALASIASRRRAPRAPGPALQAALGEVAAALGVRLSSTTTRAPRVADQIEALADASRMRPRRVVLHDGFWRQDCGAILGFLRADRRPVALVRRSGSYLLFDPEPGSWRRVDAACAATIEPEAWVFYAPLPENAARGLPLLRFALRGRSADVALAIASGVGATLLGMLVPQAMALLVDSAIPDADRTLVIHLGIALGAAALGTGLFRLSQGLAMLRLETSADSATQSAVWSRLLELPVSFFRRFSTGDLSSRVTAVSQIRARLGGTTLRSLFSSVILLLNLGLLAWYSPLLTLVAVVAAIVSGATAVTAGTLLLGFTRRIVELEGRFFGLMVQLLNGVAKLRVAAAEERAFARWATEFSELARLELDRQRVRDAIAVINVALSAASTVALFAVAGSFVGQPGAGLSTGTFLAFYVAYGAFIGAVTTLSNTFTDVMAIRILRERARPLFEERPERTLGGGAPVVLGGRLELDRVTFRYREDGPPVIADVSLEARAGEFVALVGPSGSGKSTLFRLMLGFETPSSGGVLYDGRELGGLDVRGVRRQMGVVLQGGRINAGSIFDNVAAGAQIALKEAWDALRDAGLAEEIEALPMGLHTVISEGGTNLSGGQRQRLLLARALVHRPRILLLDEATSALDNLTQKIVSDSLERLAVTRIVIAHRLSTIRRADRIYVIEAGRIVQHGRFDELAAEEGPFARLVARQSG